MIQKRTTNSNQMMSVLPLRDIVVFPQMVVPLFVGREKSLSACLKAVAERYLAANNGGNAADLQALLPLIEQKLRDYELYKLYTEMEMPLAYLLAKMELAGIKPVSYTHLNRS